MVKPVLYQVGGSVRDIFLNRNSKDKDFVFIGGTFGDMRKYILENGGQIFVETPKYFTIRATMPKLGAADYTLGRVDGVYNDGRHPENVEPAATIEGDLARRDFSMNAIAKNVETGEFVDPFNGRADIELRLIKCVGNATDRINEDKLRAFRAIRFKVQLGFSLEGNLHYAIRHLTPRDFDAISVERIYEEFSKMFAISTMGALIALEDFPNLLNIALYKGVVFKPSIKYP